MWHDEHFEAFKFWAFISLGVSVAIVLCVKSLLTYVLQRRAARRQKDEDEHRTSGHPG